MRPLQPQDLLREPQPWPLHGAAATREAERKAQAARPPHDLMERAGLATARWSIALYPHARSIVVLAGNGNNGGDGLVAARYLHHLGRAVTVWRVDGPRSMPEDATWALRQALDAGVDVRDGLPADTSPPPDLWLDALLGLGASRPADGAIAQAIRLLLHARSPVLAIDLPSGLQSDTGTALGGLAARADATLSLLSIKPGLFMGSGRDLAGRIWFDDLGVDAGPPDSRLNSPRSTCGTLRRHAQHKGSFGNVVVAGGAPGMQGAAWLAARAALSAGAGRVYVDLLEDAVATPACPWPALMWRPRAWQDASLLATSTVVCGCGGGPGIAGWLPALFAAADRLLLDADALNAVASDQGLRDGLRARHERGAPTTITPHPLEAARLLDATVADVQGDRLSAAQQLVERFRCTVVLKGSGTVLAAQGHTPRINPSGNALLATAGSGDVLAGWIGGVWAGLGDAVAGATSAALSSVWLHGHAADLALAAGRASPLTADEQIDAMVQAAGTG